MTTDRTMTRKTTRRQHIPDLMTQSAAARLIRVARQSIPGFIARGELETETVADLMLVTRASAERVAAARREKQTTDRSVA